MATELRVKPRFDILTEYALPPSAKEIYTKLNNHHGDQFGKCKITAGGPLKVGKIHILASQRGIPVPRHLTHFRKGTTTPNYHIYSYASRT